MARLHNDFMTLKAQRCDVLPDVVCELLRHLPLGLFLLCYPSVDSSSSATTPMWPPSLATQKGSRRTCAMHVPWLRSQSVALTLRIAFVNTDGSTANLGGCQRVVDLPSDLLCECRMENCCNLMFPPHQSLHSNMVQRQTRIRAPCCAAACQVSSGSYAPARGPRGSLCMCSQRRSANSIRICHRR